MFCISEWSTFSYPVYNRTLHVFTLLFSCQDNNGRRTPSSEHPSRTPSRNAFIEGQETLMPSGGSYLETLTGPKLGQSSQSQTFASVVGSSLSRSSTPDPQLVAHAPSPGLPPVGVRIGTTEKKVNSGQSFNSSSKMLESDNILAALSNMNISTIGTADQVQSEINNHQVLNNLNLNLHLDLPSSQVHTKPHSFLQKNESDYLGVPSVHAKPAKSNSFRDSNKSTASLADLRKSYHNSPPASSNVSPGGSPSQYQNLDGLNAAFLGYGLGGYSLNPSVPSNKMNLLGPNNLANNVNTNVFSPPSPTLSDIQNFSLVGNAPAFSDPLYIQYLKAAQYTGQGSYTDLTGSQKAYLESLLQSQKQYGMPYMGKNIGLAGYNYGSPSYGTGISYPGSPLASPISSGGPGSPLRIGERSLRYPFGLRNLSGSVWHPDLTGGVNGNFPSSLLEEFKSNKTRCFELGEIAGHVVEFR
jgi:pumilio RNA-binding family